MTTKLEEARAAADEVRQRSNENNAMIGQRVAEQQALMRAIKAGGLLEDPSLQRQIDDLGAAIGFLRQQQPRLERELAETTQRVTYVEDEARAVRRVLAVAEAQLNSGLYDWHIKEAAFALSVHQQNKEEAISSLRKSYDYLAELIGQDAAQQAAKEEMRDLAALRGEPAQPEPEPEPAKKKRFGR